MTSLNCVCGHQPWRHLFYAGPCGFPVCKCKDFTPAAIAAEPDDSDSLDYPRARAIITDDERSQQAEHAAEVRHYRRGI